MDEDGATSPEGASRYEPLDVPPFVPFWLACLLAAFVVGVLIAINLGFPFATHQQYRGPLKPLPSQPRLQSAPARDLRSYRNEKRLQLKGSKARLPIDIAIHETASKGWGPPK